MTKIKIVGALIFTLSIVLAILFNHVSEQSKISNNLLNTINQQKAFTQEISKNIFYIYKHPTASSKQLDDSIKSFVSNMNSRDEKLDNVNSIAIKKQSAKILLLWNNFYLEVQNFRDQSKITTAYSTIILEKLVNDIYKINLDLVVEFNKLINIHHAEVQSSITVYKNIEYVLFFLLLLLLVYLFSQVKDILSFIQKFLTTSKKIRSNSSIKELEPIKEENASSNASLSDATDNFNFLVNKINDSVEYSSQSIEHSYKSLESVEKNIEDLLEFLYTMEDDKEMDKELTKKEDAIIQSLEELTTSAQNLKELKIDLDNLISHHNSK